MPQKSGPSPAMSLISPTTTDPKIQPAADTSEGGGGGGVVGGIVHLTIPIVIPSVKMEQGVPSITVPPLVISGDNNNKPYEIGSSPAIKAERTDELNSNIGAGGGTIDKQMPSKGNISISVDVIKNDTLSAIRAALKEGHSISEVQKVTKERKHTWKELLTRSGMTKTDFKSLWAEVRRYCEDKHREDVASTNNDGATSSASVDELNDSDCTKAAGEVSVKAEPCHMPLKKRKLPSDYAASVSFDQVSMMSSAVVKKVKVENSDSHNQAETHPEREPAVVNIKEEEPAEVEEEEASSINMMDQEEGGDNTSGRSRTESALSTISRARDEKPAFTSTSWRCYKCKEENEGENFRCKSCRAWKDGHRLWICKRCSHKNEGVKKRCSACKGWKNGHRPAKTKRSIKKAKKDNMARDSSSKDEEKSSAVKKAKTSSSNHTQGPSLQDVLKALADDDEDANEDIIDDFGLDVKVKEENVQQETANSAPTPNQKRRFKFGEWDSIEYISGTDL